MIIKIISIVILSILIIPQLIHWISYIYTRFSKQMSMQRETIKLISKIASGNIPKNINPLKKRTEHSKHDNDGNTGYA